MRSDDFISGSPAALLERVRSSGLNIRQRARAMRDEIDRHFRTMIRTGMLAHGDRLPAERALAGQFGANRKTIREALDRLERDEFIERRLGSGSYVVWREAKPGPGRQFDTPSVSPLDCIEARRVIEPHYCDLAAARATADDLLRMQARLREMETARDQARFKEAGYAFHLEVVRATRNPLLVSMYEMLIAARAKAGWGTLVPLNDRPEQRDAQTAANRAIYEALRDRDAERARALSFHHLSDMIAAAAAFPLTA